MKRKKKNPIRIDIKTLQKLIKSISHLSKSQKVKVRNFSAATLAVVLVIGALTTIPQVRNYFSSQPSEASELGGINPIIPPSGSGTPISPSDAPWGTGPSDQPIAEGKTTQLLPPGTKQARINNNRIVFVKSGSYATGEDIYMLDLNTNSFSSIDVGPFDQMYPYIHDNYIVYTQSEGPLSNFSDIYLYKIDEGIKINLSNNPAKIFSGSASVYGDTVVWLSRRNVYGSGSLYETILYDIPTGIKKIIHSHTSVSLSGGMTGIWGDDVIWTDNRNSFRENLFVYDISTGQEKQLGNKQNNVKGIDIYGDWVVWSETDFFDYFSQKGTYVADVTNLDDITGFAVANYGIYPSIYRTLSVWQGVQSGYSYLADLNLSKLFNPTSDNYKITEDTKASYSYRPDIFANKVIYYKDASLYLFELLS